MWMIDIPSPFAPKSEMLAFLKDCERDKDDPKVKAAMAKVQGYLDAADRKAAGGPSRGDDVNGLTDHSIDAWRPALASLVAVSLSGGSVKAFHYRRRWGLLNSRVA